MPPPPAFAHSGTAGHFADSAGLARGLQAYAGRVTGVLFAVALPDASIIGAFAVSPSTACAVGDALRLYLLAAMILVAARIVQLALGHRRIVLTP